MNKKSYFKSGLISIFVAVSLIGCVKKIYIPDENGRRAVEQKEKIIEILGAELKRMDERLRDCERIVVE